MFGFGKNKSSDKGQAVSLSSSGLLSDYKRMTQVMIIICCVLGAVVIFEAIVISGLLPLKELVPYLVEKDVKTQEVINIRPLSRDVRGRELLIHSLCGKYVKKREMYDLRTEHKRFSELDHFHNKKVGRLFRRVLKGASSPYVERKRKGITRSVEVISCVRISAQLPNLYQVEWKSQDELNGKVLAIATFASYLRVEHKSRKVKEGEQYINPTGFQVVEYRVTKKGNINGKV